MGKDQHVFVKDAVFKLQMSLLEGIQNEDQLFAAGSVISKSDYEDVVTERSITNVCGYPLCHNSLPSDRTRKGRYRISLKEHKVYDLHETYMFCSSSCVVNSKTFAGSLQDERCSVLDSEKLNNVLRHFADMNLEPLEKLEKSGDLGLSNLKIQEKEETGTGEVSLKEWAGPSNAIEGYVPKPRDSDSKGSSRKNIKKGAKGARGKLNSDKNLIINDMDFASTIIMTDEYSVSKAPPGQTDTKVDHQIKPTASVEKPKPVGSKKVVAKDGKSIEELSSSFKSGLNLSVSEKEEEPRIEEVAESCDAVLKTPLDPFDKKTNVHFVSISERQCDVEKNNSEVAPIKDGECRVAVNDGASTSNVDAANDEDKVQMEKTTGSSKNKPKSSLKAAGGKKLSRSVTWADEKNNSSGSKDLCEVKEFGDAKHKSDLVDDTEVDDDEDMIRRTSAEACAMALNQASEAVASGGSDVADAVLEAGLIILPPPQDGIEKEIKENVDMEETESFTVKWPQKPGFPDVDLFDNEDSWFDSPPEGFSLTLSPFATMWNALFTWISSSSLAYIYGSDESSHEEYLSVNGREYPCKIVLSDGRSSEIKQTLASCLSRALPAVVAELRLPVPISTLEQGVACLLDTMSFVDPLPAFRTRQWQVVALLFIDSLSVCRIPSLTSYLTDRRPLFRKVLHGIQLDMEEYEVLKDLMVPLGRAPQFSSQSGA
ncbi:putative RNA polymerase II subunit B1 CTD phosphatase RPAP2 homolog [Arachis stenosperma]|uniref:putative RNA polymerase II subunit B1 CTD phosphatase RPAP2 homolog n=1 Tax=Arachis stenosperma TaxID=217475 RepID=UPI0025AD36EB|nr:putative RNA polymerase II subunit B1 CTD phosphatase RPAP2 homolog [Arachis stenosperma]